MKSNRLALMWGFPFGLACRCSPTTSSLRPRRQVGRAIPLLQAFGVIAAVNHMGFNWHAFYRAEGRTRPIAVVAAAMAAVAVCVTLPLIAAEGLDGFAIGSAVMVAVGLAGRAYYLTRLFPGLSDVAHMLRAMAPTVPAAAAVLALRWAADMDRGVLVALSELLLYGVITAVATMALERPLLREVLAYVRPASRTARLAPERGVHRLLQLGRR